MGADWQHRAAITAAPIGCVGLGRRRTAQGDQHAIALLQPAKGAVIGPENLQPEGVHQLAQIGAGWRIDADAHLGLGGFVALHDVSEPVAIGPGLFIGMLGGERCVQLKPLQITAAQQGGAEFDLRHEHLHAGMGVGDGDRALHLEALVTLALHAPVAAAQAQGGCGPKPVARLQPEQGEPEDQGRNQQHSEQRVQSRRFEFCGSVELAAGNAA